LDKIKEYFAAKRLSNSILGSLVNPRWVKMKMDNPDMEDDDKKHFRIGSALDCILTGNGVFEDEFLVVDASKPFGFMGKFVESLPAGITPEASVDMYKEAYDKAGYKMKIDRVIDSFWTNPTAVEYYNATRNTQGKSILAKDEYETVIACKDKLIANTFTYQYFKNDYDHVELIHQLPIYFEYMGYDCKALMDGVRINHETKEIEPFDLKTIGKNVYEFPTSFVQFGYYRQAAFYTIALRKWIEENRPELLDYAWLPFSFIVVDSKLSSSYPALIFETTPEDIQAGLTGGYRYGKHYKGVNQLIEAFKYHTESQQWDLPQEVFEGKGRLKLNVFSYGTVQSEEGTEGA